MMKETETEYLLMIDYLGRSGIFGSEKRFLGAISEKYALKEAKEVLRDHAERVEIFSREVPISWKKVEEITRAH